MNKDKQKYIENNLGSIEQQLYRWGVIKISEREQKEKHKTVFRTPSYHYHFRLLHPIGFVIALLCLVKFGLNKETIKRIKKDSIWW